MLPARVSVARRTAGEPAKPVVISRCCWQLGFWRWLTATSAQWLNLRPAATLYVIWLPDPESNHRSCSCARAGVRPRFPASERQ